MAAQDDLDRLAAFVRDVIDVCDGVLHEHPGWLRPELVELLNAAWSDVLYRAPQFVSDYESLQFAERLPELLAAVGLSEAQLELKLTTYALYREEYRARPNRTRLARLLRAADVILGSLSKLAASVEPLKEFKETIEACLVRWRRRPRTPK